jgi:signal transduction histidine kinase
MASNRNKYLSDFRKVLKTAQKHLKKSYSKLKSDARKTGARKLEQSTTQEGLKTQNLFTKLSAKIKSTEEKVEKLVARKTNSLEKKVERTNRLKSMVDANNMLLELKRKELLEKAADIESAYEKISVRNTELLHQKQEIDNQTEILREKNEELESRADSLLDQTEYLHEANETIMRIHVELAQQKEQIERKNEELLTLNNEKNNLIGIVAHDLKSPLNQIKGLVSLIRVTSPLDEEAANCLSMIESSANRLSSMIAKILDIEAIESKQLNLKFEQTNLGEVLSGLVTRFKIDADQKLIRLHCQVHGAVSIETDRNYLTQILENLLSNAIKFSATDKNVFISLIDNQDDVIIEVKDEGPGLTDDDKKKLFSKYQKLSAKPTGSESSTGLGLSIVKKFVESMKGQIWCESEAGQGASFFVKFPKVQSSVVVHEH